MATLAMAAMYAVAQLWTPPSFVVAIALVAIDLGAVVPRFVPTFKTVKQRWDHFTPKHAASITEQITQFDGIETTTLIASSTDGNGKHHVAITQTRPVSELESISLSARTTVVTEHTADFHPEPVKPGLEADDESKHVDSRPSNTGSAPLTPQSEPESGITENIAVTTDSTSETIPPRNAMNRSDRVVFGQGTAHGRSSSSNIGSTAPAKEFMQPSSIIEDLVTTTYAVLVHIVDTFRT